MASTPCKLHSPAACSSLRSSSAAGSRASFPQNVSHNKKSSIHQDHPILVRSRPLRSPLLWFTQTQTSDTRTGKTLGDSSLFAAGVRRVAVKSATSMSIAYRKQPPLSFSLLVSSRLVCDTFPLTALFWQHTEQPARLPRGTQLAPAHRSPPPLCCRHHPLLGTCRDRDTSFLRP